jgi:hypothetical protein
MYVGVTNPDLFAFKNFVETQIVPQETSLLKYYLKLGGYDRNSLKNPQHAVDINSGQFARVKTLQWIERRKIKIQNATRDLDTKIKDLDLGECDLWRDDFSDPWGFVKGWWRYHRTTLPDQYKTISYRYVLEHIAKGTSVYKVITKSPPDFDVIYVSEMGHDCEGSIRFVIRQRDRPGNAMAIRGYQREIENLNAELDGLEKDSTPVSQMFDAIVQASNDLITKFEARKRVNFHETLQTMIINFWNWNGNNTVGAAAVDDFCYFLRKFRQREKGNLLNKQFSGAKIHWLGPQARIWNANVSQTVTTTFVIGRASP